MKTTTPISNIRQAAAKSVGLSFALTLVLLLASGLARAKAAAESSAKTIERSSVELRIGGVPSDSIVCFGLRLNSVTARGVDGKITALVSHPLTVEVMHLAGTSQPVIFGSLPQGKYTDITITASGIKITSLNPVTGLLVTKQVPASYASTLHFQSALTVDGNPISLDLQINPAQIANATLGNNGIRASSHLFRVVATRFTGSIRQKASKAAADRIVGSVSSVSSGYFKVINGQTGAELTFSVDGGTSFRNGSLSTLKGLIVVVRSRADKNGFLVAKDVDVLENANGTVMDGVLSGYIPNSNLMTLASQDGSGSGMKNSIVGSGISIDPCQNPNFVVDSQDLDMTGMESLQFDADSLVVGQHVQVQSMRSTQRDASGNAARLLPETVTLEPQALTGTVANYQPGTTPGTFSFDLVFATDASMNVLNPFFYTMHVYQQRGTDMQVTSSGISDGTSVRVWGLVFYSQLPSSANAKAMRGSVQRLQVRAESLPSFIMVAGRITANQ